MAHIKLKDGTQIKIEDISKAKRIKEAFEDSNIPFDAVFANVTNNRSLTKDQIKDVSLRDEDDASSEKKNQIAEHLKEEKKKQMEEFEELLNLSPEERSKDIRFFKLTFWCLTGINPTLGQLEKAQELQLSYFKENNYPYPSPYIFKSMVQEMGVGDIESYQGSLLGTVKALFSIGANYVPKRQYAENKRIESYVD